MNKASTICVLTANRLRDGTVVFLDFEGAWSETLVEAVIARSPDEMRALKDRGTYDAIRNIVVEPYLIEVHESASGLLPIRYRERVRALGPTNHPQHGKQAEGGAMIDALAHASGAARSTGRLDLIKRH